MSSFLSLLIAFFLVFTGCSSKVKEKVYVIGIDPAWFAVDLLEKKVAVYGFCTELLHEFAKESSLRISVQQTNWDTLLDSVDRGVFAAALSGLQPNASTKASYDFSKLVLLTGPVFVTSDKAIKNISDLKGKSLSIESGNEVMLNYALGYDSVDLEYYDSYAKAVYDLSQKETLAVLLPSIIANTFEASLYKDKIFIQSKPLIDEGIRLVARHGHNHLLVKHFNAYLKKIEGKHYNSLLVKWGLA